MKVNTKGLFEADILLYDLLIEARKSSTILRHFSIGFPSMSKLQSEDNGIFIGNGRSVITQETNDMTIYNNQVLVVVSTKQTDSKNAKERIDLGSKEIIKTIKNSKEYNIDLASRDFKWINSEMIWDPPELNVKYRKILLSFQEAYHWKDDESDLDELNIIFEGPVINEG